MATEPLATLLTDFGRGGPYVAAMKGVILARCPRARIVDISHDVPAHDVLAGAFALAQAAPYFPAGTLHVVVVDPGVGTERRILAARFGGQVFLFPDNGIISLVARGAPLEQITAVRNTKYLPPGEPSSTFNGRDIFAPLAGHILNGVPIDRLGPQPDTYKLLELPAPRQTPGGLLGQILHVDGFGNLASNIDGPTLWALGEPADLVVRCGGRNVGPVRGAYGFVGVGEPVAVINSMGMLEVAVNQGRACEVLDAKAGTEVTVSLGRSVGASDVGGG